MIDDLMFLPTRLWRPRAWPADSPHNIRGTQPDGREYGILSLGPIDNGQLIQPFIHDVYDLDGRPIQIK